MGEKNGAETREGTSGGMIRRFERTESWGEDIVDFGERHEELGSVGDSGQCL